MNLTTRYMTRNDCYTVGRKITPMGIMVHSTAAPGVMAASWFDRWNKSYKAGEINKQACVHAFLDDIGVWQYLPWDHRGWHAGGSANDSYIGFEICEPGGFSYSGGATMVGYDVGRQEPYFRKIWANAVELCVYLCRLYGLNEIDIICHSEGHLKGIASNHADVLHWFPKHGESMNTFRAAVRKTLVGDAEPDKPVQTDGYYRVRKSWADAASQKGAYKNLNYAKACADRNTGYCVFGNDGQLVYTGKNASAAGIIPYTVVKGDTLWGIASKRLGNGARYREIMALNGLTSYTIYIGQILKLPKE